MGGQLELVGPDGFVHTVSGRRCDAKRLLKVAVETFKAAGGPEAQEAGDIAAIGAAVVKVVRRVQAVSGWRGVPRA